VTTPPSDQPHDPSATADPESPEQIPEQPATVAQPVIADDPAESAPEQRETAEQPAEPEAEMPEPAPDQPADRTGVG
jgi:hypothetical protein